MAKSTTARILDVWSQVATMIYVILRDRKVLQYNTAENVKIHDGVAAVVDVESKWIAKIPLDVIERIEAHRPCRVLKAAPAPKRANY